MLDSAQLHLVCDAFGLGLGRDLATALITGGIGFVLAWLYFWLLSRTQDSGVFWVVVIGGLLIGLVQRIRLVPDSRRQHRYNSGCDIRRSDRPRCSWWSLP